MAHAVLLMPSADPKKPSCGAGITFDFLRDPSVVPDTSCIEEEMPIAFDLNAKEAELLLGTEDTWDNPAPEGGAETAAQAAPARIDVEAVRRALSRKQPLSPALDLDRRLR